MKMIRDAPGITSFTPYTIISYTVVRYFDIIQWRRLSLLSCLSLTGDTKILKRNIQTMQNGRYIMLHINLICNRHK